MFQISAVREKRAGNHRIINFVKKIEPDSPDAINLNIEP